MVTVTLASTPLPEAEWTAGAIIGVGTEEIGQIAVPISDISTGGWSKVPGGAASHAATLADSDDATYIQSTDTTDCEVQLTALDPFGAGDVTLIVRVSKA